jgi:hypothetical protein
VGNSKSVDALQEKLASKICYANVIEKKKISGGAQMVVHVVQIAQGIAGTVVRGSSLRVRENAVARYIP